MSVVVEPNAQPSRYATDPRDLAEGPRQAYDAIVARRGELPPPYRALIDSPAIALVVEQLSSALWSGHLSAAALESVFLVVARRLHCDEQWRRHQLKALAAGVPAEDIDAIRRGLAPRASSDVRAACLIAKRLLCGQRIGRDLWLEGQRGLGRAGLAELCAFLGLASMVAVSINLQEVPASVTRQRSPA
jgi:alkylhydroperoxidase family enzyme